MALVPLGCCFPGYNVTQPTLIMWWPADAMMLMGYYISAGFPDDWSWVRLCMSFVLLWFDAAAFQIASLLGGLDKLLVQSSIVLLSSRHKRAEADARHPGLSPSCSNPSGYT